LKTSFWGKTLKISIILSLVLKNKNFHSTFLFKLCLRCHFYFTRKWRYKISFLTTFYYYLIINVKISFYLFFRFSRKLLLLKIISPKIFQRIRIQYFVFSLINLLWTFLVFVVRFSIVTYNLQSTYNQSLECYYVLTIICFNLNISNIIRYSPTVCQNHFESFAAHFRRRVHQGDEPGLAQRALLLLAVRPVAHRPALHPARRAPLLHQVLRGGVRQHLRRVRQADRHRFEGRFCFLKKKKWICCCHSVFTE